jgi:hypothetical protein
MNRMRRLNLTPALWLALVFAPGAVHAQEATDLPPAGDLIDRYVEAIGGRDVFLSQPASHATGTFSIPMAGLEATMDIYSEIDPITRMVTVVEIPGMGTVYEGYTGEHGWAMDPNLGPRLLEGDELTSMQEGASTEGSLRDASMFSERTTVEETELNGEACYKVRLVWNSGRETFDCYSVESGLRVATETVQSTPMGEIPVVSLLSDYREFGGILMPTRIQQQMMGNEQVITFDAVEFDDIDEERFAPPPAIQTLIDQRESGQ